MNILITGGAGYIGSSLAHALIQQKHEVILVDNLSLSFKADVLPSAIFYQFDIRNYDVLSHVFNQHQIDVVVHLAALTNPFDSLTSISDFESVNVDGTRTVLSLCKKHNITRFIFASSASVYGNLNTDKMTNVDPISPYGETKLQSEKDIIEAQIDYSILRIFNVAGANPQLNLGQNRRTPFHLIDLCAQSAIGKHPQLTIFGSDFDNPDGTAIRDYIHIDDTVQFFINGLKAVLTKGTKEIINCGSGIGSSVIDVIKTMQDVSGRKIYYKIENKRSCDPARVVAQNLKLQFPMHDLKRICQSSYDWEKKKLSKNSLQNL